MDNNLYNLPASLSEKPIVLPKNPFLEVLKRFGTDELISMFVNVIGTFIISFFTGSLIFLSLAGPVIEKIGFFPAHFKEASSIYKTTPKDKRKPLLYYYKKAVKNGSKSLLEDLLVHDPIYIVLMFLSLSFAKNTPVWALAALSFFIAVAIVAFLEVLIVEITYLRLKKSLIHKGFGFERYYESRFLINKSIGSNEVLERISKDFDLKDKKRLEYHDKYFENDFSIYSGRIPRLRLRKRTGDTKKFMQTVQLVYTTAYESTNKNIDQFRYFPILKEKLYFVIKEKMPKNLLDIDDSTLKKTFKGSSTNPISTVDFERIVLRNNEILFSIDLMDSTKDYYVLEIKSHKNKKLLIEAMRYVMKEFPVMQTTKGKFDFC